MIKILNKIAISFLSIHLLYCSSVSTVSSDSVSMELKQEVLGVGPYGSPWIILSENKPFEDISTISFGAGVRFKGDIVDSNKINTFYRNWGFLSTEKVNGEVAVYNRRYGYHGRYKDEDIITIKFNIIGEHANKIYDDYPSIIKILEINGKKYSYIQDFDKLKQLKIAYEESLDTPENIARRERIACWDEDSKTIRAMINNLYNLDEDNNSNDSEIQQKYKKEQFEKEYKEELNRVNMEYRNKILNFKNLCVRDVTPQKALNAKGNEFQKKLESAVKTNRFLAEQLAVEYYDNESIYYDVTGRYVIYLYVRALNKKGDYSDFGVGFDKSGIKKEDSTGIEPLDITISLIVKSKDEALKYSKGDYISISGKFVELDYKKKSDQDSVFIELSE
jgi:hypothetical protein